LAVVLPLVAVHAGVWAESRAGAGGMPELSGGVCGLLRGVAGMYGQVGR
jgi:hypothetical protein